MPELAGLPATMRLRNATPGITRGFLGILPAQFGSASGLVPIALQHRFHIVEGLAMIASPRHPSILVGRRVLLIRRASFVIVTGGILLLPVTMLHGGIHAFGDRFAGQPASDGSHQ